jgi:hypothetical protein
MRQREGPTAIRFALGPIGRANLEPLGHDGFPVHERLMK